MLDILAATITIGRRKCREGMTKWSRLGIRTLCFFPFSQVYQIDGGRVVLSAQLSEHVTIDQDRLNQSGIDTLRLLSRSGSRVLHCGFVRDWKSISLPIYIYIYIYSVSHIQTYILGSVRKYFVNICISLRLQEYESKNHNKEEGRGVPSHKLYNFVSNLAIKLTHDYTSAYD